MQYSHKTFQDSENLYFVTDYLSGGEIYNVGRQHLKSNCDKILFYMIEFAIGLEWMQNNDIVHRDLKPENLLIDSKGHLKIADFGFAKKLVDNSTKTMCGTPGYLSPEQLLNSGKIFEEK